MSLLIKGMEMPEEGAKLYMIAFSDGKACASYKPFEWHEVVPVPPHGRLIDADALMKSDRMVGKLMMYGGEYVYTQAEIDCAPTIIPAEEGET